eukprot:gene17575-14635_t
MAGDDVPKMVGAGGSAPPCSVHDGLCSKWGVSSYPTMLLFQPEKRAPLAGAAASRRP